MDNYMDMAVMEARNGLNNRDGGPFGAVIVKDDKIISCGHNTVFKDNDCTCHAEMNAIRNACEILNTYDLSDCVLYATSEPCLMCMSAIIWSNIKKVYFSNTKEDAERIGFRDKKISDCCKNGEHIVDIERLYNNDCIVLFNEYKDSIY